VTPRRLGQTGCVTDRAGTEAFIAFALEQLSVRNKHHEFEQICFRCAKARISSNVRIATGPVSAGGDQGRDGETFTTDLPVEDGLGASTSFVESASRDPWVMACTLQRDGLRAKVLDDLRQITTDAAQPVSRVVYFSVHDISAGHRHELERRARDDRGVELQVFTSADLKVWLAESDLLWVAERMLDLPDTLLPDTPADPAPDWYEQARRDYRDANGPFNVGDFTTATQGLRYATHDRKHDVPAWIEVMSRFADEPAAQPSDLGVRADYEVSVATIRGLDSIDGVRERVERVFSYAVSSESVSALERATVLVSYWTAAASMHLPSYDRGECTHMLKVLREHAERLFAETSPVGRPQRRGNLLGVLAYLCLQISPAAYARAGADGGSDTPPSTSPFVDAPAGLAYLSDLVDVASQAPVVPIEVTYEVFNLCSAELIGQPGFDQARAGLDAVMSSREGDSAVAGRCRERGALLYSQGRYLEALTEFHDAKLRWLNGDNIEGAILAMQMIARCYGLLGLHLAAKQYWMAAASLSDMEGAQGRHVARAFTQVAIGSYQMGMWLDSAAITNAALLANHALVAKTNGDGPQALLSLDLHANYTTLAAGRYWPHVADTLRVAFGGSPWSLDLPDVADLAGANVDWSEAEFSQLVSEQLHVHPFADAGPTRTYEFGILGGIWRISCKNNSADVLTAERLGAALQVVLCDLSRLLPYILCGDTTVTVSTDPPADPRQPLVHGSNGETLEVVAHMDAFHGRESYDEAMLLTMVTGLLFLVSVEDQPTTLARLKGRDGALLHKVFVAGPYDEIASLLRDQHYEACAALEPVRPSAAAIPESHPQVGPLTGPAPAYNPDEAIERIANSYRNLVDHLRATLSVLKEDAAYQDLVRRFRAEGWLDWQILQGTANAALSHRAALTTSMGRATMNARGMAALRAEKDGAPALPASAFTEGAVRSGLDNAVLTVASNWWNLHPTNPVKPSWVRELLSRRFQFDVDDTPHDALTL
jgi:hypothetical protein